MEKKLTRVGEDILKQIIIWQRMKKFVCKQLVFFLCVRKIMSGTIMIMT